MARSGCTWMRRRSPRWGLRDLPPYYREKLPDGRPVAEIAPVIEWGYLVYLTVFRVCQYFGAKEECQFCDINNNYRQQIQEGRPYTGVKSVADVLAALERIDATDTFSRAYTITGGSVTSLLQGKNEVEFYSQYVEAIENKFPGRWISKVVTQAWPVEDVKRLKAAGAQIYHPNYEVWDPNLFPKICPGKTRYIGRDEWIRRIVDAAEVFGPAQRDPQLRRRGRDGAAVRLHRGRGRDPLDRRGAELLHVEGHHAALHHLVPGADDAAGRRQSRRRAAGVPSAPAGDLPRHAAQLQPCAAAGLWRGWARQGRLLRQPVHGCAGDGGSDRIAIA